MIMKEIADRVRRTEVDRERTLRRKITRTLALGFAIGGAVGALAGVLYAPRTGKETRGNLIRRGCEVWGRIQESASRTGQHLASVVEERSSRVRAVDEKGVDAAKGALEEPPRKDVGADNKH